MSPAPVARPIHTGERCSGGWGRVGRTALLGLALAAPLPGAAQLSPLSVYAGPQTGWSEDRDLAIGARGSLGLGERGELVLEGVRFFPSGDGVAEPGVGVDRSIYRASLNALVTLNPGRRVQLYGGLGMGYLRSWLSLTVDGREQGVERTRWITNRIVGVRASLGRYGTPFLEWDSEVSRGRPKVWALGIRVRIR